MTRVQPSPAVMCPNCGTIVTYGVDAICYRCESLLPDDLEVFRSDVWTRADESD